MYRCKYNNAYLESLILHCLLSKHCDNLHCLLNERCNLENNAVYRSVYLVESVDNAK